MLAQELLLARKFSAKEPPKVPYTHLTVMCEIDVVTEMCEINVKRKGPYMLVFCLMGGIREDDKV